jgi:hypothetical protein
MEAHEMEIINRQNMSRHHRYDRVGIQIQRQSRLRKGVTALLVAFATVLDSLSDDPWFGKNCPLYKNLELYDVVGGTKLTTTGRRPSFCNGKCMRKTK